MPKGLLEQDEKPEATIQIKLAGRARMYVKSESDEKLVHLDR